MAVITTLKLIKFGLLSSSRASGDIYIFPITKNIFWEGGKPSFFV